MQTFLPVVSDFNDTIREKQRADSKLIEIERDTQSEINSIVTRALGMQARENAIAREKERQALIDSGTEIVFMPFVAGLSTTNVIEKIKNS